MLQLRLISGCRQLTVVEASWRCGFNRYGDGYSPRLESTLVHSTKVGDQYANRNTKSSATLF